MMQLITVHLTDKQLSFLKTVVEQGHYVSRSEAIRAALENFMKEFYKEESKL